MAGGMIPTVSLQLPLNNPRATVGALVSNFDSAYIEAVATGLQRYLENGYVDPDPAFTHPPEGATTDDTGCWAASGSKRSPGAHE
jgi:hypothetical protein